MIEYHTVCIRPVMPPKPMSNTYREKLIARFGRLPSHEELARLEQGQPSTMRQYVPPPSMTPATIAARARIIAKGEATRIEVMRVLTKPMTCPDVANALKRTRQLINRHLVILKAEGKVTLRKVKGVAVWERAE